MPNGGHDGPGEKSPYSLTPTPEEVEYPKKLRAQGKKPDVKGEIRFTMPSSAVSIPTLKGASNWDRWYQTVYGLCQTVGIYQILLENMTPENDDQDREAAKYWIEGNICMSLNSDGHSHISGVTGAYNMIKALYISTKDLHQVH